MLRALLPAAIVLLFVSVSFGQFVAQTAPPGNVQALTVSGLFAEGGTASLTVTTSPSATVTLLVATAAQQTPLPGGAVLLVDPASVFGAATVTADASGIALFQDMLPPGFPGGLFLIFQAGIVLPGGGIAFTNSVSGITQTQPAVIATTPPANLDAPVTTQAAIAANPNQSVVTVDVGAPLVPVSVNQDSFGVLDTSANPMNFVPVSGTVGFQQFGTIPGVAASRITFTTAHPLADGDVFEIFSFGVTDLSGRPLVIAPGSLRFTVADNNDDQTVTFTETFDTVANRGSVTGEIAWVGDGLARATRLEGVIGDGADGSVTLDTSMTINTDLLVNPAMPAATPGAINATDLTLGDPMNPAVTLTFTSPTDTPPGDSNFALKLRSLTTIVVHTATRIDCRGRDGLPSPVPASDAATTTIDGGHGGPGGGAGGAGSPGGLAPSGADGEGGHVDPLDPDRPGGTPNLSAGSALFGGGGGGAAGTAASFLEGGAGGGGGTASSFQGYAPGTFPPSFVFNPSGPGESWQGTDGMGAGAPPGGAAGPAPAAMVPPLVAPIGGSGGGGGGDRFVTPAKVHAAASGGGGGGAVCFGAAGNIDLGAATTIICSGGASGEGVGFFIGHGGGGSGGSIIAQTFSTLNLGLAVTFDTGGGLGGVLNPGQPVTFDGEGGRGGDGVIQLQDQTGSFNFAALFTVVIGEIFTGMPSPSTDATGQAQSAVIDSGSASVDYLNASALLDNGDTGMVSVSVIGIAEDPNNPGSPATTPMTASGVPLMAGPVDLSNVGSLDGYRYYRFIIDTSYPVPPATALTDRLPSADDFVLTYIR